MHDIHNDYSSAPEKSSTPKEWFSDSCLKIANAHNITTGTVKKIAPNLMKKINYVIYYRNLQQCLELGMKLKIINRILKFKQSDWMRPYIDFNTQKRTISNNEVDRNCFKLTNNSLYDRKFKKENKSKSCKK